MLKNRFFRILLIGAGLLLVLLLLGPLLVPVSPLEDTRPERELADPDSLFIEVNGIDVHYKQMGSGEPVYLLLHGFLANTSTWREVMAPLAEQGTVIAFDRPAFGLTERPMRDDWDNGNPYTRQAAVELTRGFMDALGVSQAILVGNSAGGTLAAEFALAYPERVQALVLVDAAIYTSGGAPPFVQPLLRTPQLRRVGPLLLRNLERWGQRFGDLAWHDPSKFTAEAWDGYRKPLQANNWDVALWEFTATSQWSDVAQRVAELAPPVLVMTGDDDRIVPTAESERLASEIPGAALVVVPNCGHVPHEECPDFFLAALADFVAQLPAGVD